MHSCQAAKSRATIGGQFNEDEIISRFFPKSLCNGTYLELGAHDGVQFSNTINLNRERGWRGVLIEGNPLSAKELLKNRPIELTVHNKVVCGEKKMLHYVVVPNPGKFTRIGAMHGVREFMSDAYFANYEEDDALPRTNKVGAARDTVRAAAAAARRRADQLGRHA